MGECPANTPSTAISACLTEIEAGLKDRVSVNAAVRGHHANALTVIAAQAPDAVVWPQSTAEVATIAAAATRHRIPLIAFGAGTSLEGHVNAPFGGITIDFSRMNKVLAVRARDMDCTARPASRCSN